MSRTLLVALSLVVLVISSIIYAEDINGELIEAAKKGETATVQALLAKGVDVNRRDKQYGWTALIWAAREGHTATVQALLAKGAYVNTRDKQYGWTALMQAAREGHADTVKALLSYSPKHPDVATSLNSLAELSRAQGQYAQAELLLKRALVCRKQTYRRLEPGLFTIEQSDLIIETCLVKVPRVRGESERGHSKNECADCA